MFPLNQGFHLRLRRRLAGCPFPEAGSVPAMDPDYKYLQDIILLTDGLNTEDRLHTSQSPIDARQ